MCRCKKLIHIYYETISSPVQYNVEITICLKLPQGVLFYIYEYFTTHLFDC